MATLNIGMKVSRAISGATTVAANAYAMVTYQPTATSSPVNEDITVQLLPLTRVFGPGQSVPSTFTSLGARNHNYNSTGTPFIGATVTVTYTLISGVELINTI